MWGYKLSSHMWWYHIIFVNFIPLSVPLSYTTRLFSSCDYTPPYQKETNYCICEKWMQWPPTCQYWSQLQAFRMALFNSCSIEDNVQVFSVHWGALMTKTDLTFPVFSIADFAVQFYLCCKFSICDVCFKFYNGIIIFPLIKEFFATCSIQWVSFLLCRQYIIFVFGKGLVFNFEINKHLSKKYIVYSDFFFVPYLCRVD